MNTRVFLLIFIICVNSLFAQVDYPIVFVHGIAAGHEKWREVGKNYGRDNYFEMKIGAHGTITDDYKGKATDRQIWNVSYYTDKPIDEGWNGNLERYSQRLELMIEKIKFYSKSDKVIIISHSMGGLIARRYMTMNIDNYNSVYKIVTVTTPHIGEKIIPHDLVGGQVKDLSKSSEFIEKLNKKWTEYDKINEKWGVIGAVDTKSILNFKITGDSTDSAGPGFVSLNSSIPFGEWKRLLEKKGEVVYDSKYFAYLVLVDDTHNGVIKNRIIDNAIEWALK